MDRLFVCFFRPPGRRWELQPTSLSRIRSWPEPFQCSGVEKRLEDCELRMNGQVGLFTDFTGFFT